MVVLGQHPESLRKQHLGVSENVVYPIVPNGFADHYPYEKWLYIIGNINPTFSDKPIYEGYSIIPSVIYIYVYIYIWVWVNT